MKKQKIIRLLPFLLAVCMIVILWTKGGRRISRWNDLQDGAMVFENGMERTGEAYGVLNEGPGMILRAGEYVLHYDIETDGENALRLVTNNTADIAPNLIPISGENGQGSVRFTVYNETDNFQILVDYMSGSFIRVHAFDMEGRTCTDTVMTLTLALSVFLGLYLLYLAGRLHTKQFSVLAVLGFAVMIVSAPCLKENLNIGDDMLFHLERLGDLTNGLRSGQFPVRVGAYMNRGYGSVSSVFYPGLFLYIPAAMILMGTSIQYAMQVFLVFVNAVTAVSMFLCARRLFEDDWAGLIASVLYTLALYRITDMYTRSAIGEALSMAFMPFVAWGLYEVIVGDKKRWPILALGAAAIVHSHMISTLICAVTAAGFAAVFLPRLVKERRMGAVMAAAVCCLLLSATIMAPIVTYKIQGTMTEMMARWNAHNMIAPAQLLLTTPNQLNAQLYDGTLRTRAIVIGGPLLLAALCALYRVLCAQKRGRAEKQALVYLLLGVLFAGMTTTLFPWAAVDMRNDLTGYLQFPWRLLMMTPHASDNVRIPKLQFPWRLLMMTTFFFSLAGGYGLRGLADKRADLMTFAVLWISMSAAMPLLTAETQKNDCVRYGNVSEQNVVFLDYSLEGTVLSDTLDRTVHVQGDVRLGNAQSAGTSYSIPVEALEDSTVTLPRFGFDGYAAYVNGKRMAVCKGEYNRLAIDLPAGTTGLLQVWFEGKAYWRIFDLVSLVTFLGLCARECVRIRKKE